LEGNGKMGCKRVWLEGDENLLDGKMVKSSIVFKGLLKFLRLFPLPNYSTTKSTACKSSSYAITRCMFLQDHARRSFRQDPEKATCEIFKVLARFFKDLYKTHHFQERAKECC
jgi:hypothetical protein